MHSGSSLTPENPAFSISIGLAALIIEGRPLHDDEYTIDLADQFQRRQSDHSFPSSALKCYRSQLESPHNPFGKFHLEINDNVIIFKCFCKNRIHLI